MIPNKILRKFFGKGHENNSYKKYKWYLFVNAFHVDRRTVLDDPFWGDQEKLMIIQLMDGEKIARWNIEYRVFSGSHLDVCIINKKKGGWLS